MWKLMPEHSVAGVLGHENRLTGRMLKVAFNSTACSGKTRSCEESIISREYVQLLASATAGVKG